MKKGLLIIDHGSKVKASNDMLESVVKLVSDLRPELEVLGAHMELAEPDIEEGLTSLIKKGAEEIVAVPYMLSPGRHATEDIPRMVAAVSTHFPDIKISVSSCLGVSEKLAEVVIERAGL